MPERYPPEQIEQQENKIEVLSTFTLPDQTEELDFKDFAAPHALFGSYYLSTSGYESFKKKVGDTLESFNGVKGGTFHEAEIPKGGGQSIKEKLNIKPISFNEWVYLFSQLTLEQLYGVNYYVVQLDNGKEVTIKSALNNDAPGPYGYSLTIEDITGKEYRTYPLGGGPADNFQPHIIFPAIEDDERE